MEEKEDRIPRVIYLQWADRVSPEGATWCVDKINEDDIEYELSPIPGWSDVLRALGKLYHCWAVNGARANDTQKALDFLMAAYDKWLD